jgi:hypothetical protein
MERLRSLLLLMFIPVLGYSQVGNTVPAPTHSDVYVIPIAVGLLGSALLGSHMASPETYSWKTNTISELAAQNYSNAWIMRSGLVGFGGLVAGAATWDLAIGRRHWARALPLTIYGTSVALAGVFSAPPFEKGVPFSEREGRLHTMFANIAGLSLSAAILGHALTEEDDERRTAHWCSLALVTACSMMFNLQPQNQGVWQRVMWASGLTWLTVSYSF